MDIREGIQGEAVAAFLSSSRKASIEMGTGTGKSKVVLDILDVLYKEDQYHDMIDTLILVPATRLRDNDWLENFRKFRGDVNRVRLECYQTAYKWEGLHFKYVIADEFDFSLTPKYSQFYSQNKYDILIAVTAYTKEAKHEMRDRIAPVCFSYSTQQAQEAGLLNKTQFFQVNYDIGWQRTMKIKTKTSEFRQSENGNYVYIDEQFDKSLLGLKIANGKVSKYELLGDASSLDEWEKKQSKYEHMMKFYSRKRTEFLHSLESSRKVTKILIEKIHETSGNKVMVFSKLTKQIEQITEHTYHSKNKKGNTNVEDFSKGLIKTLGVCDAVNRGVNLEGVNNLIIESYVGSDTDFQQRHGRGTRLEVTDTMKMFFMVPHVWERVNELNTTTLTKNWKWVRRPTQAYTWFREMTSEFDLSNLQVIEVTYDKIKDSYKLSQEYDRFFKGS